MFPRADTGPEHLHSLQAPLMLLDYTLSKRAVRSLEETLLESEEGVTVKRWVGLECSRGSTHQDILHVCNRRNCRMGSTDSCLV